MKQTTYQVVTWDDQSLREDTAFFEHESEARTYARAAAQDGRSAYVLKIETEFLVSYRKYCRKYRRNNPMATNGSGSREQ